MLTAIIHLTYAESFPFDDQYPCQTANYPPRPFRHLRHYFDPYSAAVVADCGYWNLSSSWHHAEVASASRAAVAYSWKYSDAFAVAAVEVVVAAVAAAYDAAFPQVVGAASATADGTRTGFLRAYRPQMIPVYSLPEKVAFRKEAFPSADSYHDMKGVNSSEVADDAAAFGCAVRGAPRKAAEPTEGVQPLGYRSAVRPDRQKEPSSCLNEMSDVPLQYLPKKFRLQGKE